MKNNNRYGRLFAGLKEKNAGAFIPFVTLGDPDAGTSLEIIRALIKSGADALELGFAFSDPVADGPVIQAAGCRALAAGATPGGSFEIIAAIRKEFPEIPIGLLVYANLVISGGIGAFYAKAEAAGVDSVLVADAPVVEAAPFRGAAAAHGIDHISIVPPNAEAPALREMAAIGGGYTYYLGRAGVTGADREMAAPEREKIKMLKDAGAPPIVVGFGISSPKHVEAALKSGADGAISGSAVVKIIENNLENRQEMLDKLAEFVSTMKAAAKNKA